MIRLVVADDHPVVREGLKHVSARHHDIQVVGEAENADGALQACASGGVDVLLLDVSMPGPGVIDTIQRLKAVRRPPRVLVLSVSAQAEDVDDALHAGAGGYVLKDAPVEAVVAGIRAAAAGHALVSPPLLPEAPREARRLDDRRCDS